MEVICINDDFGPEWEAYFIINSIVKPVKGCIYTIREVVNYLVGEKGLLLNEIVNKPVDKISPTTGMTGLAEQTFAISRFTDLQGRPLVANEIQTIKQDRYAE